MRRYFKSLGAEISEEKSNKGIEDDLHKIIGVCDVCFKDGDPVDIDGILNSIVSIMVSVIHRFFFKYYFIQSHSRYFDIKNNAMNKFIIRFHWSAVKTLCWRSVKN